MRAIPPHKAIKRALEDADFTQARRYAELILPNDPDNANANFAMGMSYYNQKQWELAEEFFRKYLAKKEDAAVVNNLAIVCMETDRYDEALALANRALELLPESGVVKDTVAEIEKRKAEAAKEGGETQTSPGRTASAGEPASSQTAAKAASPVASPSPVADVPAAPAKKEPGAKQAAKRAPDAKSTAKRNLDGRSAAKTKTKGKSATEPKANSKKAETPKPDGGQKDKPASESKNSSGKQPPKEGEERLADELDAQATTPVMLDGHMPSTSADSDSKTK